MVADLHYADAIQAKYEEEKLKRIRQDGVAQFITLDENLNFSNYAKDPWNDTKPGAPKPTSTGNCYKAAILGAGFGGLLFAVNLIEKSGYRPQDIIIIDRATGFGGTWYWNRYPGIMCDVDSMVYLPLLEETGYVPKHKYSYGDEIRTHTQRIAKKWQLQDRTLFRTEVRGASWDESANEWVLGVEENELDGQTKPYQIRSNILFLASGLLVKPKVPAICGIEGFKGHFFHTARWNYEYTGGSPTDWTLDKLSDKKVAVIGTGATAVQVVPQLAKWAKTLYVVQRTPAGVDFRGQHPIDPKDAEQITTVKGWQHERQVNFVAMMSQLPDPPKVDLVNDSWSKLTTIKAMTGSPELENITLENKDAYFAQLKDEDLIRTSRVRARVDEIVKNKDYATSLKAWYHTWCKRPCFHDDYLPVFNQDNVHLIDTNGRGLEHVTENGIMADGKEIEVDLIVFSTGFNYLFSKSPAAQAGISVVGRRGLSLDEKWKNLATLHGLVTRDFPNLFMANAAQSVLSPNQAFSLDIYAKHAAAIIRQASEKAKAQGASRFVLEPSHEAEQRWAERIMSQALPLSIALDCTPSYYNLEGKLTQEMSREEQIQQGRGAIWIKGPLDFVKFLAAWEDKGDLEGLEVTFPQT
ncbi:hypothetical protein BHE90_015953 [Fusarium euwallaceae]|uniref:Uncharacterized protein n=1 Tax=Fusarium euwallaceae TaxID=1147111 RepID=A0A430L1V6_9HYPO|nr:hypothetical protein BHE90_015953 [Fusarium euwallaceae]